MATVAAQLGAKLPDSAGEDSYNLLPVLLGKDLTQPLREATVHHSGSGKFAIRQGDWVFIDAPSGRTTARVANPNGSSRNAAMRRTANPANYSTCDRTCRSARTCTLSSRKKSAN